MTQIDLGRQGKDFSLTASEFTTNSIPSSAVMFSTANVANGIVLLDSLGRLPTLNGSNLTAVSVGPGTTGKLSKWNSTSTLTDSIVTEDSGKIGIGTATPFSTQEVGGSLGLKLVSKTTNYTASQETVIICDASAGTITITLPLAVGVVNRMYHIKKVDSSDNLVIVEASGSETIDGQLTATIDTQYNSYQIICDGIQWWII